MYYAHVDDILAELSEEMELEPVEAIALMDRLLDAPEREADEAEAGEVA